MNNSKLFIEIANLYISNGEVIKYRYGDINEVTDAMIEEEIKNNNKVVIEEDGYVCDCYFKEEDMHLLEDTIKHIEDSRRVSEVN